MLGFNGIQVIFLAAFIGLVIFLIFAFDRLSAANSACDPIRTSLCTII